MLLVTFNRPTGKLKVPTFGFVFDASGSAWGDSPDASHYGHDCQIAPGHYKLTAIDYMSPPIPSEGGAQIHVEDLDTADARQLIKAGLAETDDGGATLTINGEKLPIGNLATYGRADIMIHGGGSNLGVPAAFAPFQPLCRTLGCTRMHNKDLADLCDKLAPVISTEHVIFSVVGDSPDLLC